MDNIRFYEINAKYVDYLAPYAPHELLSLSVTSSARAVIGRVVRIIITDRIHAIGFLNLFILSQILS